VLILAVLGRSSPHRAADRGSRDRQLRSILMAIMYRKFSWGLIKQACMETLR
jgi:TRAP-type mannitol/chloroaromatic compound transport system permease large subunit